MRSQQADERPRTEVAQASSRRAAQRRTFAIIGAHAGDPAIASVAAQLLAQGWLTTGSDADLVLLDGRTGAKAAGPRHGSSHRILLVNGYDDPAAALASLESGTADDVVALGDTVALGIRLSVAARSIDAHRRAASRLAQVRRQSATDPLTGLGNRRALAPELGLFQRRVRAGVPCALLVADVDWFKSVNDRHGHLVGDQVLSHVGRVLAGALRDDRDAVFRFGGEEFVVLLRDVSEADAVTVADRLRRAVAGMSVGNPSNGLTVKVTMSVGLVALEGGASVSPIDALAAADAALYEAKRAGRDRVCIGLAATPVPIEDGGETQGGRDDQKTSGYTHAPEPSDPDAESG